MNSSEPPATVWLLNRCLVDEQAIPSFVERLGPSELRRFAGFARAERRMQFLFGRMLLRLAIADLTGSTGDALWITERAAQAPLLRVDGADSSDIGFSLSHSRQWIGCAVAAGARVGLDIEVHDPTRDILGISELAFASADHSWLLRQPKAARPSAFYQLWCTSEALAKLGGGVTREPVRSALVSGGREIESHGHGWHRYALPHTDLTMVLCSDRLLRGLSKVELAELSCRTFRFLSLGPV